MVMGMKKSHVPALLVALAAFPCFMGAVRLVGLSIGTEFVPGQARFAADPVPIVLHVVGATVFSILGALQFAPAGRWHRRVGWLVAPAGLVAAGAGLWMTAFYPVGESDGLFLRSVRFVAGTAMIASLVLAVIAIVRRDFRAHGRWMIRGYALGIAAGTQSILLVPLAVIGFAQTERSYGLVMALGWAINVAVGERAIRRTSGAIDALPTPATADA